MQSARDSLHLITGTPLGTYRDACEKVLGQTCADLEFITVKDILRYGVHEFIDELQIKLNRTGQAIFDRFFAFKLTDTSITKPTVKLSSTL